MSYTVEKQWTTAALLKAVVIKLDSNEYRVGHRCGYVAVTKDHPFYGKNYSEQVDEITKEHVTGVLIGKKSPILAFTATCNSDNEFEDVRRSIDVIIDAHGGITYSSSHDDPTYPIDSKGSWWFGFDCAHCDDIESIGGQTLEYCIEECESIATQLATFNKE